MRERVVEMEQIIQIIYSAVDELNEQRPVAKHIVKAPATVLLGDSGQLDSLAFLNLAVAVEENFETVFGYSISLTDGRAALEETNPFETVQTLVEYIHRIIEERGRTSEYPSGNYPMSF